MTGHGKLGMRDMGTMEARGRVGFGGTDGDLDRGKFRSAAVCGSGRWGRHQILQQQVSRGGGQPPAWADVRSVRVWLLWGVFGVAGDNGSGRSIRKYAWEEGGRLRAKRCRSNGFRFELQPAA